MSKSTPKRSGDNDPDTPAARAARRLISESTQRRSGDSDVGRAAAVAASMAELPYGANPPTLGSRMRIWKQDPSVGGLGTRTVYVHGTVEVGPRDSQIEMRVDPPVAPGTNGDFLVDPASHAAFDAVHTFAVVRETLTMYQRALKRKLHWQWNSGSSNRPIQVYSHAGEAPNAYYSRGERALKFFHFTPQGQPPDTPQIYTCRSFDIVTHETGHAILDALKPDWILSGNAQTGGLHESFGDLTAIFAVLSQFDLVEFIVAETKSDLHNKTILAALAEEFGQGLGRTSGLRNADNNLKLSDVTNEVHDISKVFTGGVYDVLADLFTARRQPRYRDDAEVLYEVGKYLAGLTIRAIMDAPASEATFADVAGNMITIAEHDEQADCASFVRKHFAFRHVLQTEMVFRLLELPGNRCGCCGTMQHPEYQVPADA